MGDGRLKPPRTPGSIPLDRGRTMRKHELLLSARCAINMKRLPVELNESQPLFDSPFTAASPTVADDAAVPSARAVSRPLSGSAAPAGPEHKSVLRRVMTRDTPRPPFADKKLGRTEVERILAVAHDTGGVADLRGADLREADLTRMNLAGAKLGDDDPLATEDERRQLAARLDRAVLAGTNLEGTVAPGVNFAGANLRAASFINANLMGANLTEVYAAEANFAGARLTEANLEEARLDQANLAGAVLVGAKLARARLRQAHCEATDFGLANLAGADLRHAYCDDQTYLGGALLDGALLEGVRYRETDLTAVDWSQVRQLGEEHEARNAQIKSRTGAYHDAARAYRRLGLALRAQGLTIEGARFLGRARHMEERALWARVRDRWQGRRYLPTLTGTVRWLMHTSEGSITAYGEHPIWAVGWAFAALVVFAGLFMALAPTHPDPATALLLSGSALLGHGYATIPGLLVTPGVISFLSVAEAGVGTALMLLFVLAIARKTQG